MLSEIFQLYNGYIICTGIDLGENTMKDSELIRKLHNGDKEAAGLMIERYYADIYRFCLYMVQSAVVKKLRIKIPHQSLLNLKTS